MPTTTEPGAGGIRVAASTAAPTRRDRMALRWELRSCGRHGHLTYRPEDRDDLRERLHVQTAQGDAWRCLRCGDYVLGLPGSSGPADRAPRPLRGPALRDAFILRFLAAERALRGLVLFACAYGVWRFDGAKDALYRVFTQYLPLFQQIAQRAHVDLTDTSPVRLAQRAFGLQHGTLMLVVAAIAAYGLIEFVEAVGLWSMKRWGEYVAVVATSVFLPYEIYDLIEAVTPLRLGAFLINVAAVLWLVWTKRLFGFRGGAEAYEKERQSASVLQMETAALRLPGQDATGEEPRTTS